MLVANLLNDVSITNKLVSKLIYNVTILFFVFFWLLVIGFFSYQSFILNDQNKSHKEVIIVSAVNYKLLHLCEPVQLLLDTRPLQQLNVFPKTLCNTF